MYTSFIIGMAMHGRGQGGNTSLVYNSLARILPRVQLALSYPFTCLYACPQVQMLSTDSDATEACANREEQDVPATHSEIRRFISAINHMEQCMSSMKRELADEAEARVAKKLKEAHKQPALKKKGHQKQFQFNEDVRKRLTEASAAIHQMPAAVERAKTAISKKVRIQCFFQGL